MEDLRQNGYEIGNLMQSISGRAKISIQRSVSPCGTLLSVMPLDSAMGAQSPPFAPEQRKTTQFYFDYVS